MASLRFDIIIVVGIAVLATISYVPIIDNGFVTWDTNDYVLQNPNIKEISLVSLRWMLTAFYISNWHPITWLSHAIDYHFYALNPIGHHITNLVFHIINSLLLYFIVKRFLAFIVADKKYNILTAGLCALLFSVHPQHVESVAWLAQRKDLLCALFSLLSILFYFYYVSSKNNKKYYYALCVTFAFALMSKPMAVTLPVILLILDVYPLGRTRFYHNNNIFLKIKTLPKLVLEKWALFLMSSVVMVIAFSAQYQGGSVTSLHQVDISIRLLNATQSIFLYLSKWVLPIKLIPFYQYPNYVNIQSLFLLLLPVFGFCAVCFISIVLWRRNQHFWLIAWLYFVVSLLPVIGIVQIGSQAAADRYTYLPMIPFYIVLAAGVVKLITSTNNYRTVRIGGAALLVVIISLLIMLTRQQTFIWNNDYIFWRYTAMHAPTSGIVRANYGATLLRMEHYEDAIQELEVAVTVRRSAAAAKWLGDAYYEVGNLVAAESRYRSSLKLSMDQNYISRSEVLMKIARINYTLGKLNEAYSWGREALRYDDMNAEAAKLLQDISKRKLGSRRSEN